MTHMGDLKNAAARADFLTKIELRGGVVLGSYINIRTVVKVKCRLGHVSEPRTRSVLQGREWCKICSYAARSLTAKEKGRIKFHALVSRLGGQVVAHYENAHVPTECLCKKNHACFPTLVNLTAGQGMCRACAYDYNRVYIVLHPEGYGKVGISSTGERSRRHRRNGYQPYLEVYCSNPVVVERAVLGRRDDLGFSYIEDARKDGYTETFPAEFLPIAERIIYETAQIMEEI